MSSNVVITGFSNIKSKLMDATSNHGAYTLFTSNQELASRQGRNGQYDFKSTMLLIWMILFVFVFIRLWKKCTVFSLKIFIDHYFLKTKKRCAITRTIVLGGNGKRTTQRSICVPDICVHLWLCRDTRRCKVHRHPQKRNQRRKKGGRRQRNRTYSVFQPKVLTDLCPVW